MSRHMHMLVGFAVAAAVLSVVLLQGGLLSLYAGFTLGLDAAACLLVLLVLPNKGTIIFWFYWAFAWLLFPVFILVMLALHLTGVPLPKES